MTEDYTAIVHGLGSIGSATVAYLISSGFSVVGVDPDESRHNLYKDRNFIFDMTDLSSEDGEIMMAGSYRSVADLSDLSLVEVGSRVHFLSVPTERLGQPDMSIVKSVVAKIIDFEVSSAETNIIVESTCVPGFYDKEIAPNLADGQVLNYIHSPRRDWFGQRTEDIRGMSRLAGANHDQARARLGPVLDRIWREMVWGSGVTEVEFAKPVENAIRYACVALTHELARSYPGVNMDEVFTLAATKWNVERYYSSLGVGGYCIPLSVRYLKSSHLTAGTLSIATALEAANSEAPKLLAAFLHEHDIKRLAVVGVRYRSVFASATESPAVKLIDEARQLGIEVFAVDHLVDVDKIVGAQFNLTSIQLPTNVDAVVVQASTSEAEMEILNALLEQQPRIVVDNSEEFTVRPSGLGSSTIFFHTRHGLPTIGGRDAA